MRYHEIIHSAKMSKPVTELAAPTIASATNAKGINRKTADRILDPKGYFKPKWPVKTPLP